MGPVSVLCRVGRLALVVLLVAVLAAVGVPVLVPAPALAAGAGAPDAGMAVGGAPVDALAPTRAAGRPLAEPSVVRMHGPGDHGFFGTVPTGLARADLVAAGDRPVLGAKAPDAALHGTPGVRGPPHAPVLGTTF